MNSELYHQDKVATAIQDYCSEKQITEADFAQLVDLNPVHLSRVKSGSSASYEALCKIAFLTGKQVKAFLKPVPKSLTNSVQQKLTSSNN